MVGIFFLIMWAACGCFQKVTEDPVKLVLTQFSPTYSDVSYCQGHPKSENICSEDDLRSRIFGTFLVKFLACLPLLGFSNI